MQFIVCKFGGSSVATSEKLQQIVKIMGLNPQRRCIVLSAPGKAPGFSIKVTDLLIDATKKALKGEDYSSVVDDIKKRFSSIFEPLKVNSSKIKEILSDLDTRLASSKEHQGKFRDFIVASGMG
jgi:aspartate kinase